MKYFKVFKKIRISPKELVFIFLLACLLVAIPVFVVFSQRKTSGPPASAQKVGVGQQAKTQPNELIVKFKPMVRFQPKNSQTGFTKTFAATDVVEASMPKSLNAVFASVGSPKMKPVFPSLASKSIIGSSLFDTNGLLKGGKVKELMADKKDSLKLIYKLSFPQGTDMENVKRVLSSNLMVDYVEPNYIFEASDLGNPSDPLYSQQWNLPKLQVPESWQVSPGGDPLVKVAVIDTGVLRSHPDFAGGSFLDGYDFVNDDNDPTDDQGHGTMVAGIIAARADNNEGIAGIAWRTTIVPVKGLDARGSGFMDVLAGGIIYAADAGAHIINMSWGNPFASPPNQTLALALAYAKERGVILVAAAGNSKGDVTDGYYPANDPNVLAISATDREDKKPDFSNYGPKIALAAPGVNITSLGISTDPTKRYVTASGTSFSAPEVSGIFALAKAAFPTYTSEQLIAVVENGARDIEPGDLNSFIGYGLASSYNSLSNPNTSSPPYAFISTPTLTPFKSTLRLSGVATSGDFDRYVVDYAPWVGGEPVWSGARSVSPVGRTPASTNLGDFDFSSLPNGPYLIRLSVFSRDGRSRLATAKVVKDSSLRNGWPVTLTSGGGFWQFGPTTVADVNGDLVDEIVAFSDGTMHVFNGEGRNIPGWPKTLVEAPGFIATFPLVVDLGAESSSLLPIRERRLAPPTAAPLLIKKKIPVIVYGKFAPSGPDGRWDLTLQTVRHDGTALAGFATDPIPFLVKEIKSSLLTADVNGDGKLEIVYPNHTMVGENIKYYVSALDTTGKMLPGWPKDITPPGIPPRNFYLEPSLSAANVDKNTKDAEIVASYGALSAGLRIYVLNDKGVLPGWPTETFYHSKDSIILADLENDGIYEIITSKSVSSGQDLLIFKGDGTSTAINLLDSGGNMFVPGRFDSDQNKDIFVEGGMSRRYWLISGAKKSVMPGFPQNLAPWYPWGGAESYSSVLDVNGDGKMDVIRIAQDDLGRYLFVGNSFNGSAFTSLTGFDPKYVSVPFLPSAVATFGTRPANTTSLILADSHPTFLVLSAYDIANKKVPVEWGQLWGNQWHTRGTFIPVSPKER